MLVTEQLACMKGERILFRGLSFTLEHGQLLQVKGYNGIGKTSLLRILCGLTLPDHGTVSWRGENIRHSDRFSRELLYCGHSASLNELLTPLENLRFLCHIHGDHFADEQYIRALENMGLTQQIHLPVRVLSQGQRRRTGLARLLLASAHPLWILDEPFTALDQSITATLAHMVSAHCRQGGSAVFTSHQDVDFAVPPDILDMNQFAV